MKTIAMRLEDTTIEILEHEAKKQNLTISEYLRQQIFPLMEGTKPLTLEQSLAKLETALTTIQFCMKPLQELLFDLQKFEAELILKQAKEKEPIEQNPNQCETEPKTP